MRLTSIVRRRPLAKSEQGYALLALLLFMALLVIAAGVAASSLAFTIRRDREEELIHRGVQYTRAIREFTKRTGRFPIRLEELDNTDGRRFLRKHYKDPITGKDFKLVHMADIQIGGASPIAGINPVAGSGAQADASNGDQLAQPASTDSNDSSQQAQSSPNNQAGLRGAIGAPVASVSTSGQPISGGLIVGVVSSSKAQTIREFNRKKHYNEWRFYYDTSFDKNYLLNAPTEKTFFQPVNAQPGMTPVNGMQGTQQPSQPFGSPASPQQQSPQQ